MQNLKCKTIADQHLIHILKQHMVHVCSPETIKEHYATSPAFSKTLQEIPNQLITLHVTELQEITLWIIKNKFSTKTSEELKHAFYRCKKAHDDTHETRDSGQPQFHHVLMTTLVSWVYSQALYPEEMFDKRQLFLACLYHDTVEDTKIFNMRDPGKQICKIATLHGQDVAIMVGFLTKMALHIDRTLSRLKEAFLSAHFITFSSPSCPFEARFIKCCDRIANFADFEYSSFDFFVRKIEETFAYFDNIIFDQNLLFKDLFWQYINSKAEKHGLQELHPW